MKNPVYGSSASGILKPEFEIVQTVGLDPIARSQPGA